jgi:NAD(P)-dependent dehydrogenase (short-subunit alcohol dehydrogenase family)
MRLAEKIVFLTGGGGGLGTEICARFASEGASVAIVDISSDSAEQARDAALAFGAPPDRLAAIACDITSPDALRAAVEQTLSTFGRVDVLCNNAGGSTLQDDIVTRVPEDEFWRVIKLDLFGTFLCCKHVIPLIAAAGGGSVINMSSIAAVVGLPGRDCYTAAKGGVAAMTRSMAVEYAPDRIRVNAIAPSVTLTKRAAHLMQNNPAIQKLASRHLLGLGEPADVANLAVYLASDESRIITGQIFPVDSGCSIH